MEIKTFNTSQLQSMLTDSSSSNSVSFKSLMTTQSEKKPPAPIDWSNDGRAIDGLAMLNGSVEDYDIYVGKDANGKAELSISRRGNNGFPGSNVSSSVPASEKIKIDLGVDLQFMGKTDGNDIIGSGWKQVSGKFLQELAEGMTAGQNSRFSLSGVYSETPTLYRANANQIDTIFAGKGNDQFRVGSEGITVSSGYADYFDGGDGRDTVYLPGKSDRYAVFQGKMDEFEIWDLDTKKCMIVKDVERLRFAQGNTENGYANLDDLVKPKPPKWNESIQSSGK